MQAELPMYECTEDALRAAVLAIGGSKKAGPMLWPDKGVDAASRLLLDSVNPLRSEKLSLSQAMLILRAARDVGCYAPFQWVASECGFDASPVTAAEEVDRLTSVLETSAKTMATAMAALERMQRARAVA